MPSRIAALFFLAALTALAAGCAPAEMAGSQPGGVNAAQNGMGGGSGGGSGGGGGGGGGY